MVTKQVEKHINGIVMEDLMGTINALKDNPALGKSKFRLHGQWINCGHNKNRVGNFYSAGQENEHARPFELEADEPPLLAGHDKGPNPVEHLLNALAACLTTSMVYHAAVRGIHIEKLESELEGDIDLNGFTGLDPKVRKGYQNIRVKFKVKTDEKNMEKLRECALFSPVHDTVKQGTNIDVTIETE